MARYSHLCKPFPQFAVIHSQRLQCSQWSWSRCSGTLLLFPVIRWILLWELLMISLSENRFTPCVCSQTHIHEHTGLSPCLCMSCGFLSAHSSFYLGLPDSAWTVADDQGFGGRWGRNLKLKKISACIWHFPLLTYFGDLFCCNNLEVPTAPQKSPWL